MAVLELANIAKHCGAITRADRYFIDTERRRSGRSGGRQRRRHDDAGEDHCRQLPPVRRQHQPRRTRGAVCMARRMRVPRGSRSSTRTWRWPITSRRRPTSSLARAHHHRAPRRKPSCRSASGAGWRLFMFEILDYGAMYKKAGELFAELEVGDAAARPGAAACRAASARRWRLRGRGCPTPRSS